MDKLKFFATAPKPRIEKVPDAAEVFVKEISAGDRDKLERVLSGKNPQDVRAHLLIAYVCDETGKPMFDPTDVAQLSALPVSFVDGILAKGNALNALSDKDLDDLEKK